MLMQLQMCWENPAQYSSHVVKWLASGALTAMVRVRFPAWEFYEQNFSTNELQNPL